MDFEKPYCPVVEVDGAIACGKQFDLDITLPCDDRNVIYGVIKDCYREPVKDAVVKLIEIVCECGKEERRPVSHTFTDDEGEFVFGPLCPDKKYEIDFWVDQVKHVKVCAKCGHEGKCLKGVKMDKCDCFVNGKKPEHKEDCKKCYKEDYDEYYKKECKKDYDDDCKKECKKDYDDDCKKECKKDYDDDCKKECKKDYNDDCKKECKKDHDDDCKKECKCEQKNKCCNFKCCR